jgi:hypothetical protein
MVLSFSLGVRASSLNLLFLLDKLDSLKRWPSWPLYKSSPFVVATVVTSGIEVAPTKRESSGRWVFWKKLRMLAFGFAGFLDGGVAVTVFLGVKDRFDLAVETMMADLLKGKHPLRHAGE